MIGTARKHQVPGKVLGLTALAVMLGACATTPDDHDLLYAEEAPICKKGATLSCIEKMGRPTTCTCSDAEDLRELFDLRGPRY